MLAVRRASERFRVHSRRLLAVTTNNNKNTSPPPPIPPFQYSPTILRSFHTENRVQFHWIFWGKPCGICRGFSTSDGHEEEELEENEDVFAVLDEEMGEGVDEIKSTNKVPMHQVPVKCQSNKVGIMLDEWLKQGNTVNRSEVVHTMKMLRRLKLFKRACDVSSWLWAKKAIDFDESYYATHLDCLFKADGGYAAEAYFETIPSKMKGIMVYRSLLRNYVTRKMVPQAEMLFKKMKELRLTLDVGDYNQMLLLYFLAAKWKIPKFLKLMEDLELKPNVFMYKILISTKSSVDDVGGVNDLVEKMKVEGKTPDVNLQTVLATHYVKNEMLEKAEEVVNEVEKLSKVEKETAGKRRFITRRLLSLYALVKREEDLERLWKEFESDSDLPLIDYISGILIWGRMGKVDKAEEVFENLLRSRHRIASRHYNALLSVYTDHMLEAKATGLIDRMTKNGIEVNRPIRSTLVRLYTSLGDVQKAESMLSRNYGDREVKPTYFSQLLVLQKFAENGDIKNAERMFNTMKKAGYVRRLGMYEALANTYIKANAPAYGFRDRLKADNFVPNRKMTELIGQLNALQ